jgi:single-strand DNA-binding protein
MADFNKVILLGRLTRDPELRYTPNGVAVSDLGFAVNRFVKGEEGQEGRKETLFIDVTVWGRQAENCAEYLKKGSEALVDGRLVLEQWETEGQRRSKVKVTANTVQFLRGANEGTTPAGAATGGTTTPTADEDYPF